MPYVQCNGADLYFDDRDEGEPIVCHQFGTERIRGLVDVDIEASRFRWDDYDYRIYDVEALRTTLDLVQRDRTSLFESFSEQVFADPSEETTALQFDEMARTPAPIKSAILFDALTRDYRDVLPGIDVPMLVCAGAAESRGTVESLPSPHD